MGEELGIEGEVDRVERGLVEEEGQENGVTLELAIVTVRIESNGVHKEEELFRQLVLVGERVEEGEERGVLEEGEGDGLFYI